MTLRSSDTKALLDRLSASEAHVFGDFALSRLLGLDISYHDNVCCVGFTVRREFTNPVGTLHGGIMATAFDISMGHLIVHATGTPAATLEIKVQYLAAAACDTRVECRASFAKRGRAISFLTSTATEAGSGRLLATATATWMQRDSAPAAAKAPKP